MYVMPGWGQVRPNIVRRANLITPLVLFGVTYRSLWQIRTDSGLLIMLGKSGATGYDEFGPTLIPFPVQRVFPGTFIVEPDSP